MHEFGARVSELLEERGMDVSGLAVAVRERAGDEGLTRAALAGMLEDEQQVGRMEIPTTFVGITEVLNLSEEQTEELMEAGYRVARRHTARRRSRREASEE